MEEGYSTATPQVREMGFGAGMGLSNMKKNSDSMRISSVHGEGYVWITLQTHQNIVAVASLKDLAAIIVVRGAMPESDTIEKSNMEGIPVFSTELDTFTISGKLFNILKQA